MICYITIADSEYKGHQGRWFSIFLFSTLILSKLKQKLKLYGKIEIKYLFHFKANFNVLGIL